MNRGRSLQSLAQELQRQIETRKDYIAPQGKLAAEVIDGEVKVVGLNGNAYGLTPYAHGQVREHLKIPAAYYDRMQAEQPGLLATNVTTWLRADADNARMVRTLDGRIRGFMSSKYRPLDNFDLGQAALPKLIELGADVISCELTETRMYIKAILPGLSDELPPGVQWGRGHARIAEYAGNEAGKVVSAVVISNSDVGNGSLRIEPSVNTTWCTNLAILASAAMKKFHIGRGHDVMDDLSIFRDETRAADDKAFWLKVKDVLNVAFDEKVFKAAVERIRIVGARDIESTNLTAVVETTVKELNLPVSTGGGILAMLAKGGDLTQWGLSSAVTAVANTQADYEVSTTLERAGGKILALEGPAWAKLSTADVVEGELVSA